MIKDVPAIAVVFYFKQSVSKITLSNSSYIFLSDEDVAWRLFLVERTASMALSLGDYKAFLILLWNIACLGQ